MNTFYFSGGSLCDWDSIAYLYPTIEGEYRFNCLVDISIFYGDFLYSDNPLLMAPRRPPVLPDNIGFNITVNKSYNWDENPQVGARDSVPTLIYKQDIFSETDPLNCLGARYLFSTRQLPTDGSYIYCCVWSLPAIEIPYGGSTIVINPLNGVTVPFGW